MIRFIYMGFLFLVPLAVFGAININGFSTVTNDRFANDGQFIAGGFDLSGVAIANDGRWLTMVSENVFLSANHFFPSNGTAVTFYLGNDPNGGSATRTIQSSQRIGTSDIRIGTLNAGLGSSYGVYNFANDDTSNNNNTGGGGPFGANNESFINSPYYESDAYLFGRSQSDFSSIAQDMAVGRNKLDTWFDDVTAASTTDDAIGSAIDTDGDSNFLEYEALLQTGDSGAPMMVESGTGELTIVGINWFITEDPTSNGFSYVGNYDADIQNFIDANPVPEFRWYGLSLGIMIFCSVVARRRRA